MNSYLTFWNREESSNEYRRKGNRLIQKIRACPDELGEVGSLTCTKCSGDLLQKASYHLDLVPCDMLCW
jgi:hypothetical protein